MQCSAGEVLKMHCLRAFQNRIRPPIAGSIITQQCNYTLEHHRDCLLDSWCKLGSPSHLLSATDFLCCSWWFGKSFCHCSSLSINHRGEKHKRSVEQYVFICVIKLLTPALIIVLIAPCLLVINESVSLCICYLDMGWCYTPGTPVLDPGRFDLHNAALGYCMSSFGYESPGCSLCCTETRSSRMTSPRSPCGLTSSPDEALHLSGVERGDGTYSETVVFVLSITTFPVNTAVSSEKSTSFLASL